MTKTVIITIYLLTDMNTQPHPEYLGIYESETECLSVLATEDARRDGLGSLHCSALIEEYWPEMVEASNAQ